MSLGTALSDLYRRLNYATTPSADVSTRLTAYLNLAQQDVFGEIGGTRLLHGTITIQPAANKSEVGLPPSISRIISIRDTAHRITLREVPESTYRQWIADPASITGIPTAYAMLGLGSIFNRPTSADQIFAVSSSASDTTQKVYWSAITADGAIISGNTTLTGQTNVQLGTLATIVEVADVHLDAACVGIVQVNYNVATHTPLTAIYPQALRNLFQRIALIATPSDLINYTIDYERDALDLTVASDDFPVPVRFVRACESKALCYEYQRLGDPQRYTIVEREYQRELGMLNDYLVSGPDQVYIPCRPMPMNSNLPANFPTSGYRWP